MSMKLSHFESDGKAVNVSLLYTVEAKQVLYVDGFLGISSKSGDSGDTIALQIDRREYQFKVPASLTVNKGDIVYVTVASVSEHKVPDEALGTSAGEGKTALFKATAAKDANDVVTGLLLPVTL